MSITSALYLAVDSCPMQKGHKALAKVADFFISDVAAVRTWDQGGHAQLGGLKEKLMTALTDERHFAENDHHWRPVKVALSNHFMSGHDDCLIDLPATCIVINGYGNIFPVEPDWYFQRLEAMGLGELFDVRAPVPPIRLPKQKRQKLYVKPGIIGGIFQSF